MIIWGSKKGDWKRGRTEVYNSRIKTKWKYSQFPPYWKYFSGLFFNHKMESVLSSHLGLIYYQVASWANMYLSEMKARAFQVGGSVVKNPPAKQENRVWSRGWEILWRRRSLPTPVFFPGKFHGQRSLVDYSPCGCKRVGHGLATKQQQ